MTTNNTNTTKNSKNNTEKTAEKGAPLIGLETRKAAIELRKFDKANPKFDLELFEKACLILDGLGRIKGSEATKGEDIKTFVLDQAKGVFFLNKTPLEGLSPVAEEAIRERFAKFCEDPKQAVKLVYGFMTGVDAFNIEQQEKAEQAKKEEAAKVKPAEPVAAPKKSPEEQPKEAATPEAKPAENSQQKGASTSDEPAKGAAWNKKREADKRYQEKLKALKDKGPQWVVAAQIENIAQGVKDKFDEVAHWGNEGLINKLLQAEQILRDCITLAQQTEPKKKKAVILAKVFAVGAKVAISEDKYEVYKDLVDAEKELADLTILQISDDGKIFICKSASGRIKVKKSHLA